MRITSTLLKKISTLKFSALKTSLGASLSTISLMALSLATPTTLALGVECGTTITATCTLPTTGRDMTITGSIITDTPLITTSPEHFAGGWTGSITLDKDANLQASIDKYATPYIMAKIANDNDIVTNSSLTFTNNGAISIITYTATPYNVIDLSAEKLLFENKGYIEGYIYERLQNTADNIRDNAVSSLVNLRAKNITFRNELGRNLILTNVGIKNQSGKMEYRTLDFHLLAGGAGATFINNGNIVLINDLHSVSGSLKAFNVQADAQSSAINFTNSGNIFLANNTYGNNGSAAAVELTSNNSAINFMHKTGVISLVIESGFTQGNASTITLTSGGASTITFTNEAGTINLWNGSGKVVDNNQGVGGTAAAVAINATGSGNIIFTNKTGVINLWSRNQGFFRHNAAAVALMASEGGDITFSNAGLISITKPFSIENFTGNVTTVFLQARKGTINFTNTGQIIAPIQGVAIQFSTAGTQSKPNTLVLGPGSHVVGAILGYGSGSADRQASTTDELTVYAAPSSSTTSIETGFTSSETYGPKAVDGFASLSFKVPEETQSPGYVIYNATTLNQEGSRTANSVTVENHVSLFLNGTISTNELTVFPDAVVTLGDGYQGFEVHGQATINGTLIRRGSPSSSSLDRGNYGAADGIYTVGATGKLISALSVSAGRVVAGEFVFGNNAKKVDLSAMEKGNINITLEPGTLDNAELDESYTLVDSAVSMLLPSWLTEGWTSINGDSYYTLELKKSATKILAHITLLSTPPCGTSITQACTLSVKPIEDMTIEKESGNSAPLILSPKGTFDTGWKGTFTVAQSAVLSPMLTSTASIPYINAAIQTAPDTFVAGSSLTFNNKGDVDLYAHNIENSDYKAINLVAETLNFTNGTTSNPALLRGTFAKASEMDASTLLNIAAATLTFHNAKGSVISAQAGSYNTTAVTAIAVKTTGSGNSTFVNDGRIELLANNYSSATVSSLGIAVALSTTGTFTLKNSGTMLSDYQLIEGDSVDNLFIINSGTMSSSSATIFASPAPIFAIILGANINTLSVTNTGTIKYGGFLAGRDIGTLTFNNSSVVDVSNINMLIAEKIGTLSFTNTGIMNAPHSIVNVFSIDTLSFVNAGKINSAGKVLHITSSVTTGTVLLKAGSQTFGSLILDQSAGINTTLTIEGGTVNNPTILVGDVGRFKSMTISPQSFGTSSYVQYSGGPYVSTADTVTFQPDTITNVIANSSILANTITIQEGAKVVAGSDDIFSAKTTDIQGDLLLNNFSTSDSSQHGFGPSAWTFAKSSSLTAVLGKNSNGTIVAGHLSFTADEYVTLNLKDIPLDHIGLYITSDILKDLRNSNHDVTEYTLVRVASTSQLQLPESLTETYATAQNSLFYNLALKKDATNTSIIAQLTITGDGKLGDLQGLSKNNRVLAAFFDTYGTSQDATNDTPLTLQNIYSSLLVSKDVSALAYALDQLQPQIYGDIEQEVTNVSSRFATFVMEGIVRASLNKDREWHVAISPVFNITKRNKHDGQFGTKSLDGGFNLSLEKRISDTLIVGGSFQYDHIKLDVDSVNSKSNTSATSENISLGVFGGFEKKGLFSSRAQDRLYVQGSFAYTAGVGSVDRHLALVNYVPFQTPFVLTSYSSKPLTHAVRLAAQAGYAFKVKGGLEVGPYMRLDVGWTGREGENESGDRSTALRVSSSSHAIAGITLGGRLHWQLKSLRSFDHATKSDAAPINSTANNVTTIAEAQPSSAKSHIKTHSFGVVDAKDVSGKDESSKALEKSSQDKKDVPMTASNTPEEASVATSIPTTKTAYRIILNNMAIEANLGWTGELASQNREVEYGMGNNKKLTIDALDAPGLGGAVWGFGLTSRFANQTFGLRYDGSFAASGTQVSNAISVTIGMAF